MEGGLAAAEIPYLSSILDRRVYGAVPDAARFVSGPLLQLVFQSSALPKLH